MTRPRSRPRAPIRPGLAHLARFARDEAGSSTIEFCIFAPVFFWMFMSSFELGMLLTRQVMLDRGLDMTVRHVRLGHFDTVNAANMHESLKATICRAAAMIPDCMNNLKLEMQPVDPRNWTMMSSTAQCIDRNDPNSKPASHFVPGISNELMVLRACALFNPLVPTVGIARTMAKGYYALVSSSAFAIEPS